MSFIASLAFHWVVIISIIGLIFMFIGFASKSYGWGIIAAVLLGVFLHFSAFSPFSWAVDNWFLLAKYTGGYILLGVVWSLVAWYLHLKKQAHKYRESRKEYLPEFLKQRQVQKLTPELHDDFKYFMRRNAGITLPESGAKISTGHLVEQIAFWPFYVGSFLLGDLIVWIARFIAAKFGGVYKRIYQFVFSEFEELK